MVILKNGVNVSLIIPQLLQLKADRVISIWIWLIILNHLVSDYGVTKKIDQEIPAKILRIDGRIFVQNAVKDLNKSYI